MIVGFGRVGRRVGDILARAEQPYLAVDSDSKLVAQERERGCPVYFGDVGQPGLLRALGVAQARVIVVTLNDPDAATRLVSALKDQYPGVTILARGHNLETCQDLSQLGAAGVVSENIEASLELSRMAMERVGVDVHQRESILTQFKKHYQEQIHRQPTNLEGLAAEDEEKTQNS